MLGFLFLESYFLNKFGKENLFTTQPQSRFHPAPIQKPSLFTLIQSPHRKLTSTPPQFSIITPVNSHHLRLASSFSFFSSSSPSRILLTLRLPLELQAPHTPPLLSFHLSCHPRAVRLHQTHYGFLSSLYVCKFNSIIVDTNSILWSVVMNPPSYVAFSLNI